MSNSSRSLRHWAMDFLSDITPSRPSSKVGMLFYVAWDALMVLVYYLIFRFFLRLTVPMLISLSLTIGCAIALPLLPGLMVTAMVTALMGFYLNEFYSVEEMRKRMEDPSDGCEVEYVDEDDPA